MGQLRGIAVSVYFAVVCRGQMDRWTGYGRDVATGYKCGVGAVIYVGQYMLFGDHIFDLKIS